MTAAAYAAGSKYKQFAPPLTVPQQPFDPALIRALVECSERRMSALRADRQQHWDLWREISEWIDPRRGQWLWDYNKQRDRARKREGRIINSHASAASEILSNGMQSGNTPRTRPWFEVESLNQDTRTDRDSQGWLHYMQTLMRSVLESSNFYESTRTNYRELADYGNGPISVFSDSNNIVRFVQHTTGSYFAGVDARDKLDTFAEEMVLTIGQMLDRYEYKRLSPAAQRCAESKKYDATVKVIRITQPNRSPFYEPYGIGWQRMPFRTMEYDPSDDTGRVLLIAGRTRINTVMPRWETISGEAYASCWPGVKALGDVKGLQAEELNKAEAIEQIPRPTLQAPPELRGKMDRPIPGETIFTTQMQGQRGISRAFELSPQIGEIRQDIREIEMRIDRHYHRDVFQAISMIERGNVRELEIDARIREQMGQIGPIVESLLQQQNDPTLQLVFEHCLEAGMVPPPPKMIASSPLRMNYVSVLAQGQMAADIDRLMRWHGATMQIAQTHPAARFRLNGDEWMKEMAVALRVPPNTLTSDDEVRALAERELKAQEAAASTAIAEQGASAAAKLSQAGLMGQGQ